MNPILLLVFAAGALLLLGFASIWFDLYRSDSVRITRRMDEDLRKRHREQIQKSVLFKNKKNLESLEFYEEQKTLPTTRERFCAMVNRSGLDVTPERLLLMMALAGLVVGAPIGWWRQNIPLGLMAAAGGASCCSLYVYRKWSARQEKIIRQLPDAFDLMSRIIRAGQTMWQAIQAVADEFEQPLRGEFAYCYEQQNLGISPDIALRDLARRTGILEVKIFVLAMLVQQQTGGNLADVLDNMAQILRSRFHMRSKIGALTAEGRLQAILLLILPIALLFIMMLSSDRYSASIAQTPNLIIGMLISEAFGAWWIRKIVNFDF